MTRWNPRRVERQWELFRRLVIPSNAPAIQVIVMRRAFYAGVEALLRIIEIDLDPESDAVTESDLDVMRDIDEELEEFARHVAKGVR